MHPDKSPFPAWWWGIDLEDAGLESVRPNLGTYAQYAFARLPSLPFALHGEFDWLASSQPHTRHIGLERPDENAQAVVALENAAATMGLPLPAEFVKFIKSPALHECIRSNTDCYLDICPSPVRSPKDDGYLIRFLSDSQGCIFWYLYLTEDGQDHAVVASTDYYGTESEQWQEEESDPSNIVFSAESFETFVCRFWLENEIWFSSYDDTPMLDAGRAYVEEYLQNEHDE